MKYSKVDLGTIIKFLDKVGGKAGVDGIIDGRLVISKADRVWREQNGIITFSVTSDGTTGPDWIRRLKDKGFEIPDPVMAMLYSHAFEPTTGITSNIAVLKGTLFEDHVRTTDNVRDAAKSRGLKIPGAEVACLIRELFMHDEIASMDLFRILVMHDPIKDAFGDADLLGVSGGGFGGLLGACEGGVNERWRRDNGFAFVISQVSAGAATPA